MAAGMLKQCYNKWNWKKTTAKYTLLTKYFSDIYDQINDITAGRNEKNDTELEVPLDDPTMPYGTCHKLSDKL